MKRLFALAAVMLTSVFAIADTIDLTGKWELAATVTEDNVPYTTVIIFEPTQITSEFGGILYNVVGDIDGVVVRSASIATLDGEQHIVWQLERETGLDYESNIILSSTPDLLSLGGDFEHYEVATMKRIVE